LQIVEGFRTEAGVRQRVVANLGRLDQLEGKKLEQRLTGLAPTTRTVCRTRNQTTRLTTAVVSFLPVDRQ
tara:strand:- start:459 stop:668 length:210 start_codon:yes stop_codon:yes gene_type:complete